MRPERVIDGGGPISGPPPSTIPDGEIGALPRWKRVLELSAIGFLAVALALLVVVLYGTVNNRWYQVIAVQGESMEPTIDQGDLILFTRPDDPEAGDIGIFQVNGKIVTHRIVDIADDGSYITQGDANLTADDWSDAQVQLVGIYRARIPWLGRLWD